MSLRVTATEVSPEEGEGPVTEILQEATAWGATPAACVKWECVPAVSVGETGVYEAGEPW